jgi:hypothetical protein
MRQIFSIRFFAAVGAVVGLFFILTTVFAAGEAIEGGDTEELAGPEPHRIDFVDQVFSSSNPDFRFDADGLAAADTELVIDGTRSVHVVAGTPGELLCPDLAQIAGCAVVADLLGEAVVWFALVPMGTNRTVEFPAIDILDDGYANLVNGWQLEYAPVLDRRCEDDDGTEVEFGSYREFREALGDDFTSIYALDSRRLEAVVCHTKVDYAPEVGATGAPDGETGAPDGEIGDDGETGVTGG